MSQLAQPGASLDALLSNLREGVFVLNGQREMVLLNPACERLMGCSAAEVAGQACRCSDLVQCQDEQGRTLTAQVCPGLAVFEGTVPASQRRLRITTRSGEERWVETSYTPLNDAEGRPELVIGVMRDISEAKEREETRTLTIDNLRQEVARLRGHMVERYGFSSIISQSPRMQVALEKIHTACQTSSPVLIVGEGGTGREMTARTIHFNGLQKEGSFVPVTCSGRNPDRLERDLFGGPPGNGSGADDAGLIAASDGGTMFLDDVGGLSNEVQAKLLRVMQDGAVRSLGSTTDRSVSTRVIVASRRSVQDMVASQRIREDFHYRFSVLTIELPPLRQRKEDIPLLTESFLTALNQQSARQVTGVGPEVWSLLSDHDWPGNVRELHHVIESAFAAGRGEALTGNEVRAALRERLAQAKARAGTASTPLDETLADVERRTILGSLRRARGQRSLAAKLMGISRSRLYRRMDALGINPSEGDV